MSTDLVFLLIILFLTFWSAFFSASEIALFSLSSAQIKTFKASHHSTKRTIAKLVSQPRDLLVTIFMLNTLVNILLQNTSSAMFGRDSSWLLKVGFPLVIVLFIGEIIPKYIAMQRNTTLAQTVAPLVLFFTNLIRPLREWTVKVTTPISRLMFFFLKKDPPISSEEIEHVLETSKNNGMLSTDEATLIQGLMDLQESQVASLMRPREEVLYYDINEPLTKLIHLFKDEQCTRIPVTNGGLDRLLGVISAQDFFINHDKIQDSQDVINYLKKPFFLPETTPAQMLLKRFNEKNERMAFVLNEYRAVTGIITFEDLVEEVVGDISDQRDLEPLYERLGPNGIIANAKLELDEFNDLFGSHLKSPNNMKTIGGWLTEKIGDIPKGGYKFESDDFIFQILSSEPNKIKKVYARKRTKIKRSIKE